GIIYDDDSKRSGLDSGKNGFEARLQQHTRIPIDNDNAQGHKRARIVVGSQRGGGHHGSINEKRRSLPRPLAAQNFSMPASRRPAASHTQRNQIRGYQYYKQRG